MRVRNFTRTLSLCAGVALGLAASTGSTLADSGPIKIGAVLAVTGPASFLGDPSLKAMQMVVEQWNEQGGLGGRPVELVHYDAQGSASNARTYANRLLTSDRVDILIGGSTTGTSMAIAPLAERFNKPFIALGSGVPIIEPVQAWTFKIPHTDRMVAERVLNDMKSRGYRHIALMSATSGFGQSGRTETLGVAERLGLEIVTDETFGDSDTDMTAQLTRIRNSDDIDTLFVFGAGQGPAIVTRNARQIGLDLPLYQSHGVATEHFIRLAGAAAEGVFVPSAAILVVDQLSDDDPQKAVLAEFRHAYRERWNDSASAFSGNAWDAMMILEAAVARAGSTDGAALRQAIEETAGLVATNGVFNMSESDHNGIAYDSLKMLEIRDGKFVLVD